MDLKVNERIDRLIPQQLEIIQSVDTFAFSLDAILLAHFTQVRPKAKQQVVDFCSGNGVIPLLLSAKTAASIAGIEIQPDVADMARRSVKLNNLEAQITIHQASITDAGAIFKKDSVDIVTCNPPYFKVYPESKINPNEAKALARHEITMTIEDIFSNAYNILRDRGKLYVVHRPERLSELIVVGHQYKMTLKRLQLVYPKQGRNAKTVLLEFMKNGQEKGLNILQPIITQKENGEYSDEMRVLIYGD